MCRSCPILMIDDLINGVSEFEYGTMLNLNRGFLFVSLNDLSRKICIIMLPFVKFECLVIPEGLDSNGYPPRLNGSTICTTEKRAPCQYLDRFYTRKNAFLTSILKACTKVSLLRRSGMQVNAKKSDFAAQIIECGFNLTKKGYKALRLRVKAILNIASLNTV